MAIINFFRHLGAALRGRIGAGHVASVVQSFERGVKQLEAAEQHLAAEATAIAEKAESLAIRDFEIAQERLRATRIATKLRDFI
jgi:hypothetical protein